MSPVRRFARLTQHLDRRGLVLAVFGSIWVVVGAGVMTAPAPRWRNLGPTVEVFLNSPWWGVAWVVCGVGALAVGALHAARRVPDDAWGFNAALLPALLYALLYLASFTAWAVTAGVRRLGGDLVVYGDSRAWTNAAVWGAISLLLLILAGWPDPQWSTARRRREGDA